MEDVEIVKDLETQLFEAQEKNKDFDAQLLVAQERIKTLERDVVSIENYMHILNHDLRGPLGNVIAFSDLVLNGDYSPEEVKKFVGLTRNVGQRAMNQMESYLALEKAERGQTKIDLKQRTVSDILYRINQIFLEFKDNEHRFSIVLKNPQEDFMNLEIVNKIISVNKSMFLSMVTNLLKNALEALSSQKIEGKIIVNFFEDDDSLCMSISNPGEISEEFRKNLFQKFQTSKKDGTGLGLYSAKLMAEAHGGTLTYEPFPGGTRFTVRIPLQAN
jgi:two-component system sensor histidine kinase/response regulator